MRIRISKEKLIKFLHGSERVLECPYVVDIPDYFELEGEVVEERCEHDEINCMACKTSPDLKEKPAKIDKLGFYESEINRVIAINQLIQAVNKLNGHE